jgi:multiple sugar transport system substrate-binding protein
MSGIVLKGITWGHSRGITPLLALSQRFSELHPHITIQWQKRTLQEFADYPVELLTRSYDLLVIDHPWVGCAAATGCVLPLDEHLPQAYLDNQAAHSVGRSHESYCYEGHQWALAIDAATPVASYRADLLEKNGIPVPSTWEEVLQLAQEDRVAVPAIPIDLLMNFYMFCIAHGREPFQSKEEVIDTDTGLQALDTMRGLYALVDREMFRCNPIAVAETMSRGDQYWYCPFAYAYSNYAREGYAQHRLQYADLVYFKQQRLRSTIGGTGLAVSATSAHAEEALAFAQMAASEQYQQGLYTESGGQPGHRSAWLNEKNNLLTQDFFHRLLPAMDRGYMRPRYHGYLYFQDRAGDPLQAYLMQGGDANTVLQQMNALYRQSRLQPQVA